MIKSVYKLWRRVRKGSVSRKKRLVATTKHDSTPSLRLDWHKVAAVLITIVALSVVMSVHLLPDRIALRPGDISPREIRAGRSVPYFDSVEYARQQQAARLAVRPVYDTDETATTEADRTVREIFDRLERARTDYHTRRTHLSRHPESQEQTIKALQFQSGAEFSDAQLRYLLTAPSAVFQRLRATTTRLIHATEDREIRDLPLPGDVPTTRREVQIAAQDELASPRDAAIVRAVALQALRPNRLLDPRKTAAAREAAARNVPVNQEQIVQGERIIGAGETVTQEHMDKFLALGLLNPRLQPTTGAAICVLAALMVFLVAFYIARTLPALYANTKRLTMLSVIILVSVFGLKVGETLLGLQFSGGQLGYLGMMSVAAAGMLVSVLLDMHLAVLIVALLAVQSGLIMNHEIRFTVMTLMSSLVGILSVDSARHKINLLRTTAALAVANLALVWLLGLLLNESLTEMVTGSAWAVASAAFATFLFWFGVLTLEKPFGILTHTMLLEMSASDRPLLKQLCAVAPGTYAHSMMVGTLAEAGAQAIGADALLCRVAGYYHDIGKMKHPEFFVENQRRENVHARLSPSLSALIITAHVRDGVEMAREHRLPQDIISIIAQHHGTTLIRYFYHQALMDNAAGGEAPPGFEERFRYPGPKPQTREAAVVMLADTVEAAARCLDSPTPERLQTLINDLVREKMEDNQFDECELTFRDIKATSDAFLHVLTAMLHGRINYPVLTPRNATGRPMEVVRADLRPEPAPQPLTPSEPETSSVGEPSLPAYTPLDTRQDTEIGPPLPTHREAPGMLDYIQREEYGGEEARTAPVEAIAMPASASRAIPIVEPEVLYGRLSVESAESSGADDRTAPGSPPSAPGGRTESRGS
jgi:putative nucleotidyltransferase with HDIG domain